MRKQSATELQLGKSLKTYRDKDAKERRRAGLLRNRHERIAREEVFPNLPRSLTTYFALESVYLGYTINLTFKAIKDFSTSEQRTRRALGVITKTVQTLKHGGWAILDEPAASVMLKGEGLAVSFNAFKTIGKVSETLNIRFEGFNDTPKCHLVKKLVTIEAVYTPERVEERTVIECDEEKKEKEE